MAKYRKSSGLLELIIGILIIAAIAGSLYYFVISPILNNEEKPLDPDNKLTVVYRGEEYTDNAVINLYSELTAFEVKNADKYTVTVRAAKDVEFDYQVGVGEEGYNALFSDLEDLSDVFGRLYTDTGFTLNPPTGDIRDVLAKYNNVPVEQIAITSDISKLNVFFEIVIESEKTQIVLSCSFGSQASGIELTPPSIIF